MDTPQEQLVRNIESTAHSIYADLIEIGKVVDYSKMTTQQLANEMIKLRLNHENLKYEMRKLIESEITKQVEPLVEQLKQFTTTKPKFIYIKFKIPLLDFFKYWYAKLKK